MKIEMLYPEVCNLFGDISNIKYLLEKYSKLPDAEIIKTEINSEPAFVTQDIDMIYMGPMPENIQEVAIRKLRPYKEKIEELIKKNVVFLVTGNAVELFGKYIENEDGSRIEALSIFDIYAKRDMMHRHNSIFLGKYEDIEIVGFKSQFTMTYGDNENNYFVEAEKERLQNEKTKLESEVARATKMLSNPGFVNKAPEAKINEEKAKLVKYQEMLDSVNERLKNI